MVHIPDNIRPALEKMLKNLGSDIHEFQEAFAALEEKRRNDAGKPQLQKKKIGFFFKMSYRKMLKQFDPPRKPLFSNLLKEKNFMFKLCHQDVINYRNRVVDDSGRTLSSYLGKGRSQHEAIEHMRRMFAHWAKDDEAGFRAFMKETIKYAQSD